MLAINIACNVYSRTSILASFKKKSEWQKDLAEENLMIVLILYCSLSFLYYPISSIIPIVKNDRYNLMESIFYYFSRVAYIVHIPIYFKVALTFF